MFDQPPGKSRNITITKLAAILAATAGISFGLCTVGVIAVANSGSRIATIAGHATAFCGWLVAACLMGLLILAVVAVVRAIIGSFSNKENQ
jgi:hypothetical protein